MPMSTKKPEDEIWYVHAPLKNEKRPIVQSIQPSNIPYLNGVMDTEEDMAKRPTIWFRETDSDFVKLSKLGGREDLLIHRFKENSKEPVPYPIPTWWTDMLTEVDDPNKGLEKKPYVFEVPAWFAHSNKTDHGELKEVNISHNYPYNTIDDKNPASPANKKIETIEEPRKYGQLRNSLHPIHVKRVIPENDFVIYKGKKIESATSMPKLLANEYQQERPKDFKEWKNSQQQSAGKRSNKNVLIK